MMIEVEALFQHDFSHVIETPLQASAEKIVAGNAAGAIEDKNDAADAESIKIVCDKDNKIAADIAETSKISSNTAVADSIASAAEDILVAVQCFQTYWKLF